MSDNKSTSSDYEYVNENGIDIELKCAICIQPFLLPVCLTICGHTFCKQCIKTWFIRARTCPTCRQYAISYVKRNNRLVQTSPYVAINTRIVTNQLDHLLIRCLLCDETNIQRRHWQIHQKRCAKRTVICPAADLKCSWEGTREALLAHLSTCTYYQMQPAINELRKELTTVQAVQNELKTSVTMLEKKIEFLLKFINHGQIMMTSCSESENDCKYNIINDLHHVWRFLCSICNEYVSRDQIQLHACSGNCICRSCVYSQYSNHRQINELSS
ncbi:unnamed protein product [Adineta ricciae]|uniref:RING-type domain-containing protein n=1 Tax=Adineta ricciae TaxID=249248 RepID=A0A815I7B7_ADIRI|nr:unnamed protein product [Adineta ricciae]